MPWNGSGNFNRVFSWVADKNAGLNISSSRMDTDTNDITANGLGNALTRDGQGQATANLPMAGFRHTNVGAAVNRTDYARLDQVQDGATLNWTTAGGTADALTATYTPSLTALIDGQLCFVRAANANATTTPTFAPNGLTAHTITKTGGVALAAGDIVGNLAELVLRYNLANTRWELLNPSILTANAVTTASITNKAVTYAKIQDVTNARLLGNNSGGAAAPQEITVGTGLLLSGTALSNPRTTPTYQIFTSGTGATYTTAVGATYIKVRAVGGGAAGGGGSAGNDTTFNSVVAKGGSAGVAHSGTSGGAGGAGGTGGTGTATLRLPGAAGGDGGNGTGSAAAPGGNGGASVFGGAGAPSAHSGAANSGSGGAGTGSGGAGGAGGDGGGGAGEYYELLIGSPAATYTYTVAAAAGTGAAGRIIVEEYYN